MKQTILATFLGLLTFCSFATAQTTSYSDIVGYLNVSIPAGKASMISFPLGSSPIVSGSFSSKSGGNVLSTSASLAALPATLSNTVGESLYYVELASGPKRGMIFEILSKGSGTITVGDASQIDGNENFVIKKFTTISDVFGATNSAGLLGGNDISSSDVVWLIVNGAWKAFFFYDDGFGGTIEPLQWRTPGSSLGQGDTRIDPDQGVLIVRKAGSDRTVAVSGTVKTSPSFVPFIQGAQIVTNPLPVDSTLSGLNLKTGNSATGLVEGNDVSNSDVLYKLTSGAWKPYFIYNDGLSIDPVQWQTPGSNADQGGVIISAGEAVLIVRKGSAFVWPAAGL